MWRAFLAAACEFKREEESAMAVINLVLDTREHKTLKIGLHVLKFDNNINDPIISNN